MQRISKALWVPLALTLLASCGGGSGGSATITGSGSAADFTLHVCVPLDSGMFTFDESTKKGKDVAYSALASFPAQLASSDQVHPEGYYNSGTETFHASEIFLLTSPGNGASGAACPLMAIWCLTTDDQFAANGNLVSEQQNALSRDSGDDAAAQLLPRYHSVPLVVP